MAINLLKDILSSSSNNKNYLLIDFFLPIGLLIVFVIVGLCGLVIVFC